MLRDMCSFPALCKYILIYGDSDTYFILVCVSLFSFFFRFDGKFRGAFIFPQVDVLDSEALGPIARFFRFRRRRGFGVFFFCLTLQ